MTYTDTDAQRQAEAATDGHAAPPREPYGLDDLTGLSMTAGAVSPAMAKHMRATMHFERQRPINERNVARLAEEMRRGWFLAGTPIFICTLPSGREYIVNGNHTLEAVAASGVTIPLVMIRKRVRDVEGAARVYSTFDLQRMRTWRDTLQAVGFADTLPMPDHVIAAIGQIMQDFKHDPHNLSAMSRQARMAAVPEYTQAAHVIQAAIDGGHRQNIRITQRAAVLAVALYTAKYQPSVAAEFWGGLAKDDGLKANDPRKVLLRYMGNNRAHSTARPEQSRATALAWNAFFEGRVIEYVKPNAAGDMRILGTPMHKGAPK